MNGYITNDSAMSIHFLFLSKNDINFFELYIPVTNFCCLITTQTHPGHGGPTTAC